MKLIVREAGAKGHLVVALVRSEVRARDLSRAQLVVGDARDEDALSRALDGCTGVISSLGTAMSPFREVTTLSIATSALITAMQRQQVRRLVCITGLGAGDKRNRHMACAHELPANVKSHFEHTLARPAVRKVVKLWGE